MRTCVFMLHDEDRRLACANPHDPGESVDQAHTYSHHHWINLRRTRSKATKQTVWSDREIEKVYDNTQITSLSNVVRLAATTAVLRRLGKGEVGQPSSRSEVERAQWSWLRPTSDEGLLLSSTFYLLPMAAIMDASMRSALHGCCNAAFCLSCRPNRHFEMR